MPVPASSASTIAAAAPSSIRWRPANFRVPSHTNPDAPRPAAAQVPAHIVGERGDGLVAFARDFLRALAAMVSRSPWQARASRSRVRAALLQDASADGIDGLKLRHDVARPARLTFGERAKNHGVRRAFSGPSGDARQASGREARQARRRRSPW